MTYFKFKILAVGIGCKAADSSVLTSCSLCRGVDIGNRRNIGRWLIRDIVGTMNEDGNQEEDHNISHCRFNPANIFNYLVEIINKTAFQSKAHLPLADRKLNTYKLTLE